MKKAIEVSFYGYGILIVAVLINWFGAYLQMTSWYDVLSKTSFVDLSLVNIIWLSFLYPLLLGLGILTLVGIKNKIDKRSKNTAPYS